MAAQWPAFSISSNYVHRGAWTNWNDDYANGGRLTTSKEAADLLMIFAGILFVFMESGLCSLVTFALFWYHGQRHPATRSIITTDAESALTPNRATKHLRDAVWHQRQTALRNSGDFLSIVRRYTSIWHAYRSYKPRLSSRVLRTAIFSLLAAGIFLVALPFLTTFVLLHERGNEVLIQSDKCGLYDTPKEPNKTESITRTADVTHRWYMAMQYADACYAIDTPSELCDNYFVKRKLATNKTDVPCPFEEEACLAMTDQPAVRVTTRELDSHKDLGLNAEHPDRIRFDRNVTCAPIDLRGKFAEWDSDNMTMAARLGPVDDDHDDTFWGSFKRSTGLQRYTLHGFEAGVQWQPIRELNVSNHHVSVVFLHNPYIITRGMNGGPCSDPFFSSTHPVPDSGGKYFRPDRPITAIGCVEQFTFKNPANHKTSDATTIKWSDLPPEQRMEIIANKTRDLSEALDLNPKQKATLQLTLWGLASAGTIGEMIGTVGVSALRAMKDPGTYFRLQNPIPDDQWKNEVQYWVDIGLAALQQEFVRFATGPLDDRVLLPGPKETNEVCNMQKIKHTEFENFRRPGFITLATVGGFLIVVPWLLLRAVIWLGRRKKWLFVSEWIAYGDLQLLRMANEGAGVHGWRSCDRDVPFIFADEIARVDVSDVQHPRMVGATEMVGGRPTSTLSSSTTRLISS